MAMTDSTESDATAPATASTKSVDTSTADTGQEHPDANEIRRQVEYYFSDENLPTDLHLLQCCGGRNNDPVSISRICGFKKMRHYKPRKLVIAALRKSAFLDISADGKTIQRKVPLQGRCLLDPDFHSGDDIAYDSSIPNPKTIPVPQIHQTKKEIPPSMTKNMMKPTGFEATYIEAPITPKEAEEEAAMYDPDKPFVERIELAIQCFKKKRRMHQKYAHVFNKMMLFGGVEQSQRIHQGLSKQDMGEMDTEEIARALATHHVPWDRADDKKWAVDFEGIAKAFLSSWYPSQYSCNPSTIKNACQVPRSFYNYLRYHKVCPEYDQQLVASLKVCDLAEKMLAKFEAAGLALPGLFNISASVVFGGAQSGMYTGNRGWADEAKGAGITLEETSLCDEEARIRFSTGVAIMGSEEQYERLESKTLRVLLREATGLEVISIEPPTDSTRLSYTEQNKRFQHKLGQLEPLGKLLCTAWFLEVFDEWDLPKDEYPNGTPGRTNCGTKYEFWVEESALEQCFVGMKLDAVVLTLEGGIWVLDEVKETMCSFYMSLPNELWLERKPKEVRWLRRGQDTDDEDTEVNDKRDDEGERKASVDDDFDDE